MQKLLTPKQARELGYIPISEAVKRTGKNRTTFNRQVTVDGEVVSPGCLVGKGSRAVVWILESAIDSGVSTRREKDYDRLFEKWIRGMEAGIYSHKNVPVSPEYIENKLRWGMSKYWKLLGEKPSISGLNRENFQLVMANKHFEIDMVAQRDWHASKQSIYDAVTRFMCFLVSQGLKSEADLADIRKQRPGKRFKLERRALDPEYVRQVIEFNRSWRHGRTDYDIRVTDMLIHLYFFTGVRRMGAAGLLISNIDFANEEMIVLEKGCKERVVPLNFFPELIPRMKTWLEHERPKSDTDYFLVQADGSPLTKDCIKDRFQRLGFALRVEEAYEKLSKSEPINPGESARERHHRLRKLAKQKARTIKNRFTPHPLRHTFATMLVNDGIPAPILQKVLGHEDLDTTQGYIGVTQRDIRNWAQRRKQAGYKAVSAYELMPASSSESKTLGASDEDVLNLLLNEE